MTAAIRFADPSDGAALAGIYGPSVTDSATSFETVAPDAAEMSRRVEKIIARTPWLVYESDGLVLGYAYASPFRDRAAYQWSVEVSAYVASSARGKGVARALYEALLRLIAMQGFHNAYAGITLPNEASVRLHTALGFTPIGVYRKVRFKHGAWHDVAWYEREVAPHSISPPPPRALSEPGVLNELEAALARRLAQN